MDAVQRVRKKESMNTEMRKRSFDGALVVDGGQTVA
jgi:hypothetical protein